MQQHRVSAAGRPPLIAYLAGLAALLIVLGGAVGGATGHPAPAARPAGHARVLAHPEPQIIHDYLIRLRPGWAQVLLRLSVAPPLVPQVYRRIDTNGDGQTQP